jgi:hypothetical protein
MRRLLVSLTAVMVFPTAVLAADGVSVRRGDDVVIFGNCVPSLTVDNNSGQTINYLQVDLALSFANGDRRVVELKSAYREGISYPIPPGGRATLKQHLDTSLPTGAACTEIGTRLVVRTICETEAGTDCASHVMVWP